MSVAAEIDTVQFERAFLMYHPLRSKYFIRSCGADSVAMWSMWSWTQR